MLLKSCVTQIDAGSNHSVFLMNNGQVYTCGNAQVSKVVVLEREGRELWKGGEGTMEGR